MREKDLQRYVMQTAKLLGWRGYHTWNSIHSQKGFPDCVLLRPPRLVVIELKVGRNKPTPDQRDWLDAFALIPGVESHLFTDKDWLDGTIERILR